MGSAIRVPRMRRQSPCIERGSSHQARWSMKYLRTIAITLSILLFTAAAQAHIVQTTTALHLAQRDLNDRAQFQEALRSAMNEILTKVIAFEPALITLTGVQVIGEQIYAHFLIADAEGVAALGRLNRGEFEQGHPDRGKPPRGKPEPM